MSAVELSTYFNNSVQILFIALGSSVAAYTLDLSVFNSERQQNIRTSELFEELDIDILIGATQQYREFSNLVLDVDSMRNALETERMAEIERIWASGIEDDFSWLSRSISRLIQCGELGECNARRVNRTICFITDDSIRQTFQEPVDFVPQEMTVFVVTSRVLMANYQKRSCGFLSTAIDYLDEAVRR